MRLCLAIAATAIGALAGTPTASVGSAHWAFQPLCADGPPTSEDASGARNEVDGFIHVALRREGLHPSPEADRRTLIRRASLDLTGLLPSPQEVDRFVENADPSSPAYQPYEGFIDRLLASPHYGEQWARHWLDIARYSDTKGYVFAREEKRWVHAWAYRDWVIRALNADMAYDHFLKLQIAADQLVPAGSPDLAAMGFLTVGRRFLGVAHDIIDDRIDVVMRGTLGLTVACARCHDHKYDPISQRDYYSLYGVFQSCAEALVPCSELPANGELTTLRKTLADTMARRRDEQMARSRARVREHLEAQLELEKYPQEGFDQILDEKDLNPYIVRRWQDYLAADARRDQPIFAEWHRLARAQDKAGLRAAAARYASDLDAIDQLWRAYLRVHPHATALPDPRDEALRLVLHGPGSPCVVPDEHIANIEMYFPTAVITELWKLQGEVDRWLVRTPAAPAFATILVDRPQPSIPRVFLRGNPLTKGEQVARQFLPALAQGVPTPFMRGSGRLELAEAIVDARNPLTARVIVNRVWQHHFGRGLVASESDFGKRADPPSHPALLDWLARRFIDSGWSLKKLHRLIMTSATYRQASRIASSESVIRDPENRLLGRMNAHRLSFEEARDGWLSAAGELDLSVGGRPVPLFGKENRRTLYGLIDRESVPPVLRTFDFANPDLSIAHRSETTVPQQALFGMNHAFVAKQARALVAHDALTASDDGSVRLRSLYARIFQRAPLPDESRAALAFIRAAAKPLSSGKAAPLDAWEQLTQVLMLSNEFMFVD